ncbi:uncharacterized protein M421DRAFT_9757 [Didymella exigua CBS 183.55]|uniref:Ubiquitin 3 binding protein But2 C-terminal domain-containing protein n=1 Tax=Didymella exigua CBS 183.55 TaxID=1150837 RepID=A0A6A5R8S9_9PLEO|nr:uncharacterized protein M421DRAFT_9757 [Didymella exigua CBS 183.55]KAF1923384.1 hypothetical protein M421DRAFT_9757 [Didymella exigua CBS 183.55]
MFSGYILAFANFLALVTSAPTPSTSSPGLATVDLRIVGPQSAHYTTDTQSPTSDQNRHLTIIVGQTLSLDHDPIPIQGLQVAAIKAGDSLSLLPTTVETDDWRVTCLARIYGREDLFEFDIKDKGVLLAGGRLAKVTRLSCAVVEEATR